jgi:hypothetical protein
LPERPRSLLLLLVSTLLLGGSPLAAETASPLTNQGVPGVERDGVPMPRPRPEFESGYRAVGRQQIGDDSFEVAIFHEEGRERQEIIADDFFQVTILRPDRDLAYIFNPYGGKVLAVPLEETWPLPLLLDLSAYEVEEKGEDKLDGWPVRKLHVTPGSASVSDFDVYVWEDEHGIPRRIEGQMDLGGEMMNVVLVRREIDFESLDPALFEPPLRGPDEAASEIGTP